jgi:hypothetical protein
MAEPFALSLLLVKVECQLFGSDEGLNSQQPGGTTVAAHS